MEFPPHPSTRVMRGFAFVDVCGFTSLIDRRGDDAAVQTLTEFRAWVRYACTHHGVRVAKWLGDGAMLVGVEPGLLVQAVCEIVVPQPRECPRVRAGLAVGEVLVFEGDDYIGRTVNLAARLCDHAGPGEILVAASGEHHLPTSVPMSARDPVLVRGFRAPIEVFAIGPATTGHLGGRAPAV